jgi:hypothetical protein
MFEYASINYKAHASILHASPPQLVADAELFVCCYRLLEEGRKGNTLGFSESSIITSIHPCGENFSCCITLRLESQ